MLVSVVNANSCCFRVQSYWPSSDGDKYKIISFHEIKFKKKNRTHYVEMKRTFRAKFKFFISHSLRVDLYGQWGNNSIVHGGF